MEISFVNNYININDIRLFRKFLISDLIKTDSIRLLNNLITLHLFIIKKITL